MVGLAAVAYATVSAINPASGETAPGGSATAIVTVDSGISITCLTANSNGAFLVTFDGLPSICRTGTWFATMEVTVPALTTPGLYTITVQEVDPFGAALASHPWPLMVSAPATTTTLFPDPTITLLPPTSTTTLSTTTTALVGTSTPSPTSLPAPGSEPVGNEPNGESAAGGSGSASTTSSTLPAAPDSLGGQAAASEQANAIRQSEPFSEIRVSSGLIDLVDRALPPVFAQAMLSPFVIVEVLIRALGRTTAGLVVPLAMTVALGIGLARRLRHDAEQVPDLNDRVEIPVEETGEDV